MGTSKKPPPTPSIEERIPTTIPKKIGGIMLMYNLDLCILILKGRL